MRSGVTPADASSVCTAPPRRPARASSRCSVETYSSLSRDISSKAAISTSRSALPIAGSPPPCCLGRASSWASSRAASGPGATSRRCSSDGTRPSSWRSRASSRCSGSTLACCSWDAACCAAWRASWERSVNRSRRICLVYLLPQSRSPAALRPILYPQSGDPYTVPRGMPGERRVGCGQHPMPPALRRPRSVVVIAVVTVLCVAAVLGARANRLPDVHARAAGVTVVTDLPRPAWYGLRVLSGPTGFVATDAGLPPPDIRAAGGILVDIDRGTILWQHDAHAQLPPASTAKILTALVALENFSPAARVTVPASAVHLEWDETRMGLAAGQAFTIQELLTGMLLVSGNDAANAMADGTVGMERFVGAMNGQVAALGLHDSHFTSPVGLQDQAQYSSAYDLAVISAAAVRQFPLFRQIVAMRTATLPATAGHPQFDMQSIDTLLAMYPAAVGIKPGWTGDAGYCEVGMAVRDGHRLISVLLNANYSFSQSRRLLDWGFTTEGLASTLPPPTAVPSPHA